MEHLSLTTNKINFKEKLQKDNITKKYTNQVLPKFVKPLSSLDPYTGSWTKVEALHLLKRTTFGATLADANTLLSGTVNDAVNTLLTSPPLPSPPVNTNPDDPVPVGSTWVNASFNPTYEGNRRGSLIYWWTGQMVNQNLSIQEKMTLFWHNHFVTELNIVGESRFSYKYCNLLRTHALGNFKTLAKLITIDPAMLVYLNGTDNIVGSPNENYARELFELFTIGKGEQVGDGDYTTYTEDDVLAAAKVLTGWVANQATIDSLFVPARHDTSDKQFSHRFADQIITNNGANEYEDLIDMIFSKIETAKFICRKIYRWFVYYVIDDDVEMNMIEPMANILVANNYEIKPVLDVLFKSQHFFDLLQVGCIIKNPADFNIGAIRQLKITLPNSSDLENQYDAWLMLYYLNGLLEMALASPPQVAGWAAYYQSPQYHQIWINSVTTPYRKQITDAFTIGLDRGDYIIKYDALDLIMDISDPSDCNIVVDEFAELLFPIPITSNQRDFLKETLRPGISDIAWSFEWSDFISDPTDPMKREAMDLKVRTLLNTMLGMAEYNLA